MSLLIVWLNLYRNPENGFTLLFSSSPFPGYQLELEWVEKELGGNWYKSEALGMGGWLCPALIKYFNEAPERIYAQFKDKIELLTFDLTLTLVENQSCPL